MQDVAVRAAVTPLLVGGARLAGRRWGHQVGGWLVALPLTSGPVGWLLSYKCPTLHDDRTPPPSPP